MNYIRFIIYAVLLLVQISVARGQYLIFLKDSASLKPITGAVAYIDSTHVPVAISDNWGRLYVFKYPSIELEISAINYNAKKVVLNQKMDSVFVYLQEKVYTLNEVEVIGRDYTRDILAVSNLFSKNYNDFPFAILPYKVDRIAFINDTILFHTQYYIHIVPNFIASMYVNCDYKNIITPYDTSFISKVPYLLPKDSVKILGGNNPGSVLFFTYYLQSRFKKKVIKNSYIYKNQISKNRFSLDYLPNSNEFLHQKQLLRFFFKEGNKMPYKIIDSYDNADSISASIAYKQLFVKPYQKAPRKDSTQYFLDNYYLLSQKRQLVSNDVYLSSIKYIDTLKSYFVDPKFISFNTSYIEENRRINISDYFLYSLDTENINVLGAKIKDESYEKYRKIKEGIFDKYCKSRKKTSNDPFDEIERTKLLYQYINSAKNHQFDVIFKE